jgi:hypothetical protein
MAALANKRQRISISSGALFCENTLHRHRSIDRSVSELRRLIAVVVNELVVLVSEAFFSSFSNGADAEHSLPA